jgi:hypothetical protein
MSDDKHKPTLFTMEALLAQVESKMLCHYVWPDEGYFDNATGKWTYYPSAPQFPLIVDLYSASAVTAIYNAINEGNKRKLIDRCDSRGLFAGSVVPKCFELINKRNSSPTHA